MTSRTLEDWIAQLEMELNPIPSLTNSPNYYQYNQIETTDASPVEQLAATLGEDFPHPPNASSHTASPEVEFDRNSLTEQSLSAPHISVTSDNHRINYNNNGNTIVSSEVLESQLSQNKKEEAKKQTVNGGKKRKRQPSQAQDHIIAERNRRELLRRMLISLSALVPGLNKVDKTSVIGEAIKHMKQLQERVKELEEVVAKKTVESVVVVKKSKVILDNNSDDDNIFSSTVDEYNLSGSRGNSGGNDGVSESDSLPEIEVKISGNSLILRVFCEKKKAILAKLFTEVDKYDMSITYSSVMPFESLALEVSIAAQMGRGFNKNAKDFVRTLRSALC